MPEATVLLNPIYTVIFSLYIQPSDKVCYKLGTVGDNNTIIKKNNYNSVPYCSVIAGLLTCFDLFVGFGFCFCSRHNLTTQPRLTPNQRQSCYLDAPTFRDYRCEPLLSALIGVLLYLASSCDDEGNTIPHCCEEESE